MSAVRVCLVTAVATTKNQSTWSEASERTTASVPWLVPFIFWHFVVSSTAYKAQIPERLLLPTLLTFTRRRHCMLSTLYKSKSIIGLDLIFFSLCRNFKWNKWSIQFATSLALQDCNSHAIWDYAVLPATWQRWHSCLYPSRLKLVLNLPTTEGCK